MYSKELIYCLNKNLKVQIWLDHIFLHVDKEELDRRVGHWHPLLECHLILTTRTFLQKLADSAVKGLSQKETILWLIIPENCCLLILKSSPWSFVSWVVWASVKMATCQHVTLSNTSTVIPWFENLHQITQIISWIYRLNLHQRRLEVVAHVWLFPQSLKEC